MTSLLFIGFHVFLYFLGRGVFLTVCKLLKFEYKLDKKYIGNTKFEYFYPLIALFIIGNLTVAINFFIGTNNIILFVTVVLILFMNFLKTNLSLDKSSILYFVAIPFILSISSYGINLAQDAGLYHLNTQGWIREERIHFGLYNLHSRYGYSSLFDYISSNFWLEQNYLLLHFINLTFIVLFFIFLYSNLFLSTNTFLNNLSILVLIFGVLDNFGLSGGRNGFIDIEAVTKYDTPFAILYFLSGSLIINNLITKTFSTYDLLTIAYLLLFSLQLRIFAITLLPLFFLYLFKFVRKEDFKYAIKILITPIFFTFIWLLKNILISSCLFFPVKQTCLSFLPWSDVRSVALEAQELNIFHIYYSFDQNINSWLQNWLSKEINYSTFLNYFISLGVLFVFNLIIFKKSSKKINKNTQILIILSIIIPYIFWILSAPGIRFGLGLFLLSICLLSINYHNSTERFKVYVKFKSLTSFFIFLISIFLVIRLDTYSIFLNNFNLTNEISPTSIAYVDNNLGWGVVPQSGLSSCWVNIECIPVSKKIKKVDGFYNYFVNLD